MKKALSLIALLVLALPCWATSYYISPSGSDAANGTSTGTPWLSPNHALNCGDVIQAAAGTYSRDNFQTGKWGVVTCVAANNVAWLKCAVFDTCYIADYTGYVLGSMYVDKSYWGVQGWEITNGTAAYDACFGAFPNSASPVEIHHIIFANNIANGCSQGAFVSANNGTASIDYLAIIGNIGYNASQASTNCASGISVYQPVVSDPLPGTHIYIAGNFMWHNVDGNPCAGGSPMDGEGITLDTLSGVNTVGLTPYTGQAAVVNNIMVFNGNAGFSTGGGGSSLAPIFLRNNTMYGNFIDSHINASICGQSNLEGFPADSTHSINLVQEWLDLAMPSGATEPACGSNPAYAFYAYNATASDHVFQDFGYSAAGNNTAVVSSTGFSFGPNNTFGVNPNFANPIEPAAPSCSGKASTVDCMGTVIANFTPTNAAAKAYGYQAVSTTSRYDPMYPQWLCSVTNLPTGLVTPGCVVAGSSTASGTGSMK